MIDADDLVGLAEACEILGLTNATVSNYLRDDPSFPRPVRQLRCSRIWVGEDLRNWSANRVKTLRGRPTNKSIRDEAAKLAALNARLAKIKG